MLKWFFLFALGIPGLSLAAGVASAGDPPKFDRFRAYLIWEDTGKLSKNIGRRTDQIVANGEEGTSVQMLVDIVAKGEANTIPGGSPMMLVWVTDPLDSSRPAMIDRGWPLNFIGPTGEAIRSIVVDHDCGPVTLHARIDFAEAIGKEYAKEFNITCGD